MKVVKSEKKNLTSWSLVPLTLVLARNRKSSTIEIRNSIELINYPLTLSVCVAQFAFSIVLFTVDCAAVELKSRNWTFSFSSCSNLLCCVFIIRSLSSIWLCNAKEITIGMGNANQLAINFLCIRLYTIKYMAKLYNGIEKSL